MLINLYRRWQCYIWGHSIEIHQGLHRDDTGIWKKKGCLWCGAAWFEPFEIPPSTPISRGKHDSPRN